MRIEIVPLILGVIVGLIGIGLIYDAWTPDEVLVKRERRRRPRTERNRGGETAIGFGVIGMAAAFIGRDTWRYSVIAVIAGTALVLLGAILNFRFLGAMISNRGSLRRRPEGEAAASLAKADKPQATGPAKTGPSNRP